MLYKPITWGRFFSKCCGAKSKEEEVLQNAKGDKTFKLQKAVKRWWHYRLGGFKKPTGMVKFCDDDSDYTHPGKMPEKVTTPDMGEQPIGVELPTSGNRKRSKARYKAFFNKEEPQQENQMPRLRFQKGCGVLENSVLESGFQTRLYPSSTKLSPVFVDNK